MSRKRRIDTRNLVVCETFDEFAEKVGHLDPNVEDIVGYVTSVSRVFYWLNVESVWGVLGFTWDSLETLEGVPFLEERLEHVEASGAIIDYSQKDADWKLAHAVKKGYGHFNATTMLFSILPKLPDGYRITGFVNTFDNIASDEIEVQKNDWSNFHIVANLVPANKSLIIDLTDAHIDSRKDGNNADGLLFNGLRAGGKSKLYIKADFSNLEDIGLRDSHGHNHTCYITDYPNLIVDEDNKYLNLPRVDSPINSGCVLYYKGQGPLKIEYFFKEVYSTTTNYYNSRNYFYDSVCPVLYSENNKYEITVDENNNYYFIARRPLEINNTYASENEEALDITLNTNRNSNVLMSHYLTSADQNILNYNGKYNYKLNPIKYKGNVTSIDWYNPYLYIYGEYPTFDADLYSKIIDTENGKFMPFVELISLNKCPYTLDLSNRNYFNIFTLLRGKEYTADYLDSLSNAELLKVVGNNRTYVCDVLPEFTGLDKIFELFNLPGSSLSAPNVRNTVLWKCPNIKTKIFVGSSLYLGENNVIECTELCRSVSGNNKNRQPFIVLHDTENVHLRIIKDGGFYNIDSVVQYDYINVSSTFNYIEFKDVSYSIPSGMIFGKLSAADREFFKQSVVDVVPKVANITVTNYIQPYVMSNSFAAGDGLKDIATYLFKNTSVFNPSFIFIYKVNPYFSYAILEKTNVFTPEVIQDIVYHIEPLTDPADYNKFIVKFDRTALNTITGTDRDVNTPRGAMIDYIENTAHYMVSIDENK